MNILITYQYFLPAYKAGGPVQSISNIATMLSHVSGSVTYILCSNADLDGTISDVPTDTWVDYKPGVKVYYNATAKDKKSIDNIIAGISPDVIFINGLYSIPYTIYPLLYKGGRKILSARGMLHPGALSQKRLKKQLFLTAFKAMGLHRKCEFHATTQDEVGYIEQVLGKGKKVWMIANQPNVLNYQQPAIKPDGAVTLVSVSLISPMKNIQLILHALKRCSTNISYHIYGPVKDATYWAECLLDIKTLPSNISVVYKGEVQPHNVASVLKEYHYFILPSKSENFGHAIFEALSAGRPVITSHNTPWNGLKEANAGYNVNPEDIASFAQLLNGLAAVTNDEYVSSTIAARKYILGQYDIDTINDHYKKMFSLQ